MTAYYNENDKQAAAWLRELIQRGLIADGIVDDRSIEDVVPNDLDGFTQCHFFAGIGGWSLALRNAGWPDDRSVWTGSCPCQPFSSAGKGKGFADERHLWPSWHWLIRACITSKRRNIPILGEQVANGDGNTWFDLVQVDLEAEGYPCGSVVFPACGVGGPMLSQRRYWMAAPETTEWGRMRDAEERGAFSQTRGSSAIGGMVASDCKRRKGVNALHREDNGRKRGEGEVFETSRTGSACELGATERARLEGHTGHGDGSDEYGRIDAEAHRPVAATGDHGDPGAVNGFWRDADWLYCRDGWWRPVEPGTFPLAYGVPARVGRLRGYGNAIVIPQAVEFVKAVRQALGDLP